MSHIHCFCPCWGRKWIELNVKAEREAYALGLKKTYGSNLPTQHQVGRPVMMRRMKVESWGWRWARGADAAARCTGPEGGPAVSLDWADWRTTTPQILTKSEENTKQNIKNYYYFRTHYLKTFANGCITKPLPVSLSCTKLAFKC